MKTKIPISLIVMLILEIVITVITIACIIVTKDVVWIAGALALLAHARLDLNEIQELNQKRKEELANH